MLLVRLLVPSLLCLCACRTAAPAGFASGANPLAASAPGDSIDRFVHRVVARLTDLPALAVVVVRDSEVAYLGAAGYRDLAARRAATPETPFYIASSTKSFTGLAVAMLAAERRVDLDAPVSRYLPELRLPAGCSPASVTLRRLLTHTAGLENEAVDIRTAYTGEYTSGQLVALLERSTVTDGAFRYDNLGYVVASLVLDRVTGTRWQDLLQASLFEPLGFRRTSAYMSRASGWGVALPYLAGSEKVPWPLEWAKRDATMHAAGGMVSSAADLARWLEANLNDGRIDGHQVLPAAAVREAHRMQVVVPDQRFGPFRRFGYALGWYWGEFDGDTLLHQFGEYAGARAHVSFMPGRHIGVAVLLNASGPVADVADLIATYAYDALLGKPDLGTRYDSALTALADRLRDAKARAAARRAERAARASTLSRPAGEYVGSYTSLELGRIDVREEGTALRGGALRIRLGPLSAVSAFYTRPEAVRVEFAPGQGEVLQFFVSSRGVDSLAYSGYVFRRQRAAYPARPRRSAEPVPARARCAATAGTRRARPRRVPRLPPVAPSGTKTRTAPIAPGWSGPEGWPSSPRARE